MKRRPQKSKVTNYGGLFYFTIAVVIISIGFVSHITFRNECIDVQLEISDLVRIKKEYENKVKFLDGEVNSLMSPNRIERVARERFGMVSPEPESLIVIVWTEK